MPLRLVIAEDHLFVREGIRRMYEEQQDVYYYITLMNENYPHPGMPDGAEPGIIKGLYLLKAGASGKGPRVQLMGSGTILREVMAAADLLRDDFKVNADIWSATSFNELRRDAMYIEDRLSTQVANARLNGHAAIGLDHDQSVKAD